MKDIEEIQVSKELEFRLTEEEYVRFGKKAADLAKVLGDKERDFDSVKKKWKGEIEAVAIQLDETLRTIRQGTEFRNVECTMIKDFRRHLVQYVYRGEVMHERPLELGERQMEIVTSRAPSVEQ